MTRSMSRALLAAALAIALTACAGRDKRDPPPPVREVKVPVLVPCIEAMPAKPAFAVDALPLGADVWEQMAALRAERMQRKGYEAELEAELQACLPAPVLDQEKTR